MVYYYLPPKKRTIPDNCVIQGTFKTMILYLTEDETLTVDINRARVFKNRADALAYLNWHGTHCRQLRTTHKFPSWLQVRYPDHSFEIVHLLNVEAPDALSFDKLGSSDSLYRYRHMAFSANNFPRKGFPPFRVFTTSLRRRAVSTLRQIVAKR